MVVTSRTLRTCLVSMRDDEATFQIDTNPSTFSRKPQSTVLLSQSLEIYSFYLWKIKQKLLTNQVLVRMKRINATS